MNPKTFEDLLDKLKSSRKPPAAGDVFVIKPRGHGYYFGRVINPRIVLRDMLGNRDEENSGPFVGALVYVYDATSQNKAPIPRLSLGSLLVPPAILDQSCWRTGCLETVGSVPVMAADILQHHCFQSALNKKLRDEEGLPLKSRSEPCGDYGLTLPLGLAKSVTRAIEKTS